MNDRAKAGLIAARTLINSGRTWSAQAVKELTDDMELAIKERDEAYAAVLALRDALDTYKDTEIEYDEVVKVMADTDSLYRRLTRQDDTVDTRAREDHED